MDRGDLLMNGEGRACFGHLTQGSGHPVNERVELVKGSAYVFADVHAAHRHMGKEAAEARYLLVRLVSTVVYHYVDARDLRHQVFPEAGIGLVADEHADAFLLVGDASGLDVDPVDLAPLTEVGAPHRQTAAAEDSYLDYVHLLADELGQVAVVDREVMPPLPESGACCDRIEVRLQRVAPVAVDDRRSSGFGGQPVGESKSLTHEAQTGEREPGVERVPGEVAGANPPAFQSPRHWPLTLCGRF